MKSVQYHFKGLMAPVFTAFTTDKKNVNYAVIDKYAQWLKQKGVNAVLVNGTTGEGTCLRVEERKRTAEEWLKACRKYQMTIMVQVGGTAVIDVHDLAEHAEKIGADAVLCLPDLFFKPSTEEDLVQYLREVAEHCPTRPILYYHIPSFTGVNLSMPRFCDLADKNIPSFSGIKYTNGDMHLGAACLKPGRNILLGSDTILVGALALGFEAAILTTLNICPEFAIEAYEAMQKNMVREAATAQEKLNKRIHTILGDNGDWVEAMKTEFNKVNGVVHAGPYRKPQHNVARRH